MKQEASKTADYLWDKKIENNYDYENKDVEKVDDLILEYIETFWGEEDHEKCIYACLKKVSGQFVCKDIFPFFFAVSDIIFFLEEIEKERKKEEVKKFKQDIKEARTMNPKSRTTFIKGGLPSLGKKR